MQCIGGYVALNRVWLGTLTRVVCQDVKDAVCC